MISRSPTRIWRVALVAFLTTLALALLFQGATGLVPQRALAARLVPQIITQWNFETPPTPPTPPAPSTGVGSATRGPGLAGESYPAGNGSVAAWSFTNWPTAAAPDLPNDYVQFAVSTVGYTDITLGFAERRSGTGIRTLEVHYSTDGTAFTLLPGSVTGVPDDTNFRTQFFDLSAITALDNNPNAAFRIYGYSAEAAAGTWRFDDVTISGEPPAGTAEVAVSKSGPAQAQPNDVIAYVIQVDSQGASPAANVTVTDTLPAEVTYQSYTSSTPLTFTNNAPTLIWDAGTVMTGTSFFITVNVQVSPLFSQTITNTVQVATTTSGDNPANNQDSASTSPPVGGVCGQTFTPISSIQGSGAASPLPNGTPVTTEGVVVGDFQTATYLNGFFIQDPTGDGNVATSDGLFVFAPSGMDVAPGDRVRVSGNVTEFFTLTEIESVSSLILCSAGNSVAPTVLDLPVPVFADFEQYEGMLVTFPETLTAAQNFFQGRYGQVTISAEGRMYHPNNGQGDTADYNLRRSFILDDGRTSQNPAPIPYMGFDDTLRAGDTIVGMTGILSYGPINSASPPARGYIVQPTVAPTFTRTNDRTPSPEPISGTIKVASFNVLNYFNGDGTGGGFPTPRGASSAAEFVRQRTKIITAVLELDADVVGLIEIENDGFGANSAVQDLVNGLNAASAPGTYAVITEPALPLPPGADEIKVTFIYKPARVALVGAAVNDMDAIFDRPPVAQMFEAYGQRFTVIVNHFKSKGSCPTPGTDIPNEDNGQGCWNAKRVLQAARLMTFADSLEASTGDDDFLIIGDLNSYNEEDPIDALRAGGYIQQAEAHVPAGERYSYIFDGASGELDYAISSSGMDAEVADVTIWHINADEPSVIDYNLEFKPDDRYTPTAYRSSDHDPVLIGLDLALPVAAFSLPDYQVPEPSGSGTVTVTLSTTADLTGTVQYQTLNGSATAGVDYTSVAGTLTFAPGATSANFSVPILDDVLLEGSETVILELQPLTVGGASSGGVITATLTILDNEVPTAVTLTELGARPTAPLGSFLLAGLVLLAAGLLHLRRR